MADHRGLQEGRASSRSYSVHLLSDPRDGQTFDVAWRERPAGSVGPGTVRYGTATTQRRIEAIEAMGLQVSEQVVAAHLDTEREARRIQAAVISALQASFTKTDLVSAVNMTGLEPGIGRLGRASTGSGFLDHGHRGRLESLVLQQQAEIAVLNAALDRVRALSDLARWSDRIGGPGVDPLVRVSDLERALG